MDETKIIERFFADIGPGWTGPPAGPGDDCALLTPPPEMKLALSADTSVAGVHFPENLPAADVGWRCLAVALSDLAACGARPDFFTLSLSMLSADEPWLESFAKGLDECAQRYKVRLVGGDLVRGGLACGVQVGGWVGEAEFLPRSGAGVGDAVCITLGADQQAAGLGAAAAGMQLLVGKADAAGLGLTAAQAAGCLQAFVRPEPQIAAGLALAGLANACIDISDGLAVDLHRLCRSSGIAVRLDSQAIPLCGQGSAQDLQRALQGGDDYQLCFTLTQQSLIQLDTALGARGRAWQQIGTVESGAGVELDGEVLQPAGWDHFAD